MNIGKGFKITSFHGVRNTRMKVTTGEARFVLTVCGAVYRMPVVTVSGGVLKPLFDHVVAFVGEGSVPDAVTWGNGKWDLKHIEQESDFEGERISLTYLWSDAK